MKELDIKGYNLDRFLDEIMSFGIVPRKMKRVGHDELIIEITDKEYKNLLVKKCASCYNINVVNSRSKFTSLIESAKRCGLIAGLLVALFIISTSLNIISDITINVDGDNSNNIEIQTRQILKDHNIEVGKQFDVSYKDLENLLLSKLESSARVLVKRSGGQLTIDITELVEKPETEHQDIVANFDGKITEIKHSSGILRVNIGEGVVKGQTLIESGYVGDFFVEARGEIFAKVVKM